MLSTETVDVGLFGLDQTVIGEIQADSNEVFNNGEEKKVFVVQCGTCFYLCVEDENNPGKLCQTSFNDIDGCTIKGINEELIAKCELE